MTPRPAAVVMVALALAACTDGGYRRVAGNYYVSDSVSAHVHILKKSGGRFFPAVEEQVVDFETAKDYLLVRRKVAESFDCYDKNDSPTIITRYSDEDEYWVIDVKKEKETGPLKEEAFAGRLKELGIPPVTLKVRYYFHANTGAFEKWRKECKKL